MNRTALITGASRGLGVELASFLAKQGYDLVITARGEADLEQTATELRKNGGQVVAIAGDVSSADHRRRLANAARGLGRLDLLINNASDLGVSPLPRLTDYPTEAIERVFSTNFIAPIALIRETLPLLETSHGLIVNLSSDAAQGGYPGWGVYGASKAALDLATLTLANELETRDVGVVGVDPGDMRTKMHQDAFPGEDISDRPLPGATLPFWAWLLGQPHEAINGKRYRAQSEKWEVAA